MTGLENRPEIRHISNYTDPVKPTPPVNGGGGQEDLPPYYRELWFIVLMGGIALVLLAIVLGVMLNKALNRSLFTRERPPLVASPLQKRSPMTIYPPSGAYLFDTVPDTTSFSNSVTLKGFTMHQEGIMDIKCEVNSPLEGELGILSVSTFQVSAQDLSQNSLRRSVSQMMDRASMSQEGEVWHPRVHGHDSGMFMEDEEFVDTIKGFSTVPKVHTMFTDTNL